MIQFWACPFVLPWLKLPLQKQKVGLFAFTPHSKAFSKACCGVIATIPHAKTVFSRPFRQKITVSSNHFIGILSKFLQVSLKCFLQTSKILLFPIAIFFCKKYQNLGRIVWQTICGLNLHYDCSALTNWATSPEVKTGFEPVHPKISFAIPLSYCNDYREDSNLRTKKKW